ncbi:MAG: ABC transporter ATP-binding protein, partial [Sphingobacteriales bacterium]
MKLLLSYLKPYKWMVALTLLLAAVNIGFSLCDPIIFGRLIKLAFAAFPEHSTQFMSSPDFLWGHPGEPGVVLLLLYSIGVAMLSRIAKNFQDYFLQVVIQKFGAKVFTDGLRHSMQLPYAEFEDQRSGETLSILQKVRTDTERFITNFVNILFTVIIGIVFVAIFAARITPMLPVVYFGGIALLVVISNLLSKKVKTIQKTIVTQTTQLAGTTTESLRNIELVKS